MAGIYVHFPFCSSRCIYCDFYSRVRRDWKGYCEAVAAEAARRSPFLKGVPPLTIYFGGGTPSLLPAAQLLKVVDALHNSFDCSHIQEFTVEVNPDDVTVGKAAALKSFGVNRVSIGVQSFDDDHLRWMKRRHTSARAVDAFRILRREGFDNLSIDLIFGYTGLSDDRWLYSIERALELRPEHISCYQMMGRYADESQEKCRHQYDMLCEFLFRKGYDHYEISNFALPGYRSLHNSSYWSREAYLGLGAAAHSFDGDRTRCWNVPDIDSYLGGAVPGSETLSETDVFNEQIMLSLRTSEGLDPRTLEPRFFSLTEVAFEKLLREGLLQMRPDGNIVITSDHIFVSDWIISRLFI